MSKFNNSAKMNISAENPATTHTRYRYQQIKSTMNIVNELQLFEEKVRDIFFYTSKYGVYKMFKGKPPTKNFDSKQLDRLCLEGFKIAQSKLVIELKELQKKTKEIQERIIKIKREHINELKNDLTELNFFLNFLNYQTDIFRNLADTIAWQLLNGQHYLFRRLYTHETGEKNLLDKSFDFVLDFSEKINADPDSFCLITDITNNIQLGDCLVVDNEGIKITEIKSGEMNFQALKIIDEEQLKENNFNEEKYKEKFDKNFIKQLKRILTQKAKTDRAAKIIKENKGQDPKYKDTKVSIVENDFQIETYHSALINLIKKLEHKDYAYDCIEGIVHIGVYKNEWRIYGETIMNNLCTPYPFTDLMAGRGIAICEPIFLKPFIDEKIIDIVLGRIKIYIGIDFDKLIEFSNLLGIKASWSTSKELHKILENGTYNSKEIFSFNNKGIKIEIDGQEMFLGHGFVSKIIFDQFLPSTMLLKYQKNNIDNIK